MGQAGQPREGPKEFTLDHMLRETERVYREVLGAGGPEPSGLPFTDLRQASERVLQRVGHHGTL